MKTYWYESTSGKIKTLSEFELKAKGGKTKFFGGSPMVVSWGVHDGCNACFHAKCGPRCGCTCHIATS